MKVDLHIHTTASDGCWGPEELIIEAKKAGLQLFAVADHESVGSVAMLLDLAPKAGLNYVSGIELTSKLGNKVCHLLGYGIDHNDAAILELCKENTQHMRALGLRQMENMKKLGYNVDLDEFQRYRFDKRRGGNSVLNYLLDRGLFKTFSDALKVVVGQVEWTSPHYRPPGQVVSVIKNAGGHPVLAHPGSTLIGTKLTIDDIEGLIAMGVEGLECYTSYHDERTSMEYVRFCRDRDLLITAGSDCHGPVLKSRVLGKPDADTEDLNLKGIWPK